MKHSIGLIAAILFSLIPTLMNTAMADDGHPYGWMPRFYDGSKQEGRNVCLGIIIADNGEPGLEHSYTVGGYVFNTDLTWILFEDRRFFRGEAVASIRSEFKDSQGKNYYLYLFVVPDACLSDENTAYSYRLYEYGIPDGFPNDIFYTNFIKVDFFKTGEDCSEITEDTCTSLDLTEFYSWEAGEEDDDDETPVNTDDDDDNDDSDDGQCGGCASSNGKFSFPLALGMFLIGLFALGVARKRSERKF